MKPLASEQTPGTSITLIPGVRRTVLANGLRIVTEKMAGVRSVALGVYVGVGSRHESAKTHGCAHFLEHLLFKGTPSRTAMEISSALDEVGGEFNAFTAKEYTCYHARVLDEDFPMAVEVLGDMLTNSTITAADVEAEREVILDEIAMHEDDPEDVVHNLFAATAWAGRPLAKPIAGTVESIKAMTPTQIRRYYKRHYVAPNITIAVAGNLEHAAMVRLIRKAFATLPGEGSPLPPSVMLRSRPARAAEARSPRQFEQVNVVLGVKGLTRSDPRRHVLGVLNAALGGGSSSRLFQEVRENRGLAYSVYSFGLGYSDAGMVGISVGTLPAKTEETLEVVRAVLAEVAADGITEEELRRGKGQLRRSLVLGFEDSASRMSRLGETELFQRELLSPQKILERIEAVTLDDVALLARELFSQPETLAVVGPA